MHFFWEQLEEGPLSIRKMKDVCSNIKINDTHPKRNELFNFWSIYHMFASLVCVWRVWLHLKKDLPKPRVTDTELQFQRHLSTLPIRGHKDPVTLLRPQHSPLGSHRPTHFLLRALAALLTLHTASLPTPPLPFLALFTTCLATDLWLFSSNTS